MQAGCSAAWRFLRRPASANCPPWRKNCSTHCRCVGRAISVPCRNATLEYACDLARQLGPSAGSLLVNYDLHYDNVLAGEREPWLAVDPKVVAGDLEYGLAQLLWCRLEEIEAQSGLERHFAALVEAAAVDPEFGARSGPSCAVSITGYGA